MKVTQRNELIQMYTNKIEKEFRHTNPCDWPAENPPLCEVYKNI